ncbi:unnamed protein product [Durusdinium trenchii]|uniref:Uncharacterized protein n=1 Tax=Durusdinium trenchii TaxID=1381693 RepID=A0ABP0SL96_9DINO
MSKRVDFTPQERRENLRGSNPVDVLPDLGPIPRDPDERRFFYAQAESAVYRDGKGACYQQSGNMSCDHDVSYKAHQKLGVSMEKVNGHTNCSYGKANINSGIGDAFDIELDRKSGMHVESDRSRQSRLSIAADARKGNSSAEIFASGALQAKLRLGEVGNTGLHYKQVRTSRTPLVGLGQDLKSVNANFSPDTGFANMYLSDDSEYQSVKRMPSRSKISVYAESNSLRHSPQDHVRFLIKNKVPLAIRGEKRYWPYKKTGATKKKQVRKHDLKRNNKALGKAAERRTKRRRLNSSSKATAGNCARPLKEQGVPELKGSKGSTAQIVQEKNQEENKATHLPKAEAEVRCSFMNHNFIKRTFWKLSPTANGSWTASAGRGLAGSQLCQ